MEINRIAYNKIAEQWAGSRDHSFLSQLVVNFASGIIPQGKILDIGCGTGYPITSYLSECGFTITGIDFSEKLLQKALDRHIPNTTFHLCDFFDFNPTEKFDGIIAFDSFFHFPKEKQTGIYATVSNWMNEGAYLLFTHGKREGEITGDMFGETFYYSCLDNEEIRRLLLQSGLEIVYDREIYQEKGMDRDWVVLASKI